MTLVNIANHSDILIGSRPQSGAPYWSQSLSVMTEWVGTEREMIDLSLNATIATVRGTLYIFKNKREILIINTNLK